MIEGEISPISFEKDLSILTDNLDDIHLNIETSDGKKKLFFKTISLLKGIYLEKKYELNLDKKDLSDLTNEDVFLLKKLIDSGKKNKVLDLFISQLGHSGLNGLSKEGAQVLNYLIIKGKANKVLDLFKVQLNNLDISNLEEGLVSILKVLIRSEIYNDLFQLLRHKLEKLDLSNLGVEQKKF